MFIFLVLLSACAPKPPSPIRPGLNISTQETTETNMAMGWFKCRFKIHWPENTRINFTADLLIAHAIIKPLLTDHSRDIQLWRFHRRAARDRSGHQFSFMVYTDERTAQSVMSDLEKHPVLDSALNHGLIEKVIMDKPSRSRNPRIEDTSDRSWSPAMQRHWPAYIMGVSALWLGLIDEALADQPVDGLDIPAMLERYGNAESAITHLWHNEGQHALLHHLNAIFGYEPMMIKKRLTF